MKFLVDECSGPALASWLRDQNFDVFSIYENACGISDEEVIRIATHENRILITNDKDFGEMIFRDERIHRGVILLRLEDERSINKIKVLSHILKTYWDSIEDTFIVATEKRIRFAKSQESYT